MRLSKKMPWCEALTILSVMDSRSFLRLFLSCVWLFLSAWPLTSLADPAGSASISRVVGYYPGWGIYSRGFEVADLPGDQLTHINYAFANLVGGECVLGDPWADVERHLPGDPWSGPGSDASYFGNFRQLDLLQEEHPALKTLISIGGWTWSGNFSDAALTPASRARFATSCADFMENYGFDGIDIDWEYPGVSLLKLLLMTLIGVLTIALGARYPRRWPTHWSENRWS